MGDKVNYAKRSDRITKEELCIILAFWMEKSPLLEKPKLYCPGESEKYELLNGVGAVLVTPNGMIFALDCSRNDVHGVASLLMKYPNHVQDSTIYSSRKPCSFCTKLLVQCRVAKVFYLPIKPERSDIADIAKVDHLFKVSQMAQREFVPNISESVIENAKKRKQVYSRKPPSEEDIKKSIEEIRKPLWLEFDSKKEDQVIVDMENMFHWLTVTAIHDPDKNVRYRKHEQQSQITPTNSGPDIENGKWQELALHTTRIAKIISHKTDDPKTGVGAVILMENKEIVAIGWNGFPSKALYGDFPRASKSDDGVDHKKYPYVLHAEQNALLNRNKINIDNDSTTLFVTKIPCHECVPLLIQAGIKNVVLPHFPPVLPPQVGKEPLYLNYDLFKTKLKDGFFRGFELYEPPVAEKNDEPPVTGKKDEPLATPTGKPTNTSGSNERKRKHSPQWEPTYEEKDRVKRKISDSYDN